MKWMKMLQIHTKNLLGECITGKLTPESIYPKADIIIGYLSCQPFSVGGKQLGFERFERDGFPIFYPQLGNLIQKFFCLKKRSRNVI